MTRRETCGASLLCCHCRVKEESNVLINYARNVPVASSLPDDVVCCARFETNRDCQYSFLCLPIVVVYRRYFEWLLSMYNRSFRRKMIVRPKDGGIHVPSFPSYYRAKQNSDHRGRYYQSVAERNQVHPAEYLRDVFSKHFDDVLILNMYQKGSFFTNFFEAVMPDIKDVMQKQKQEGRSPGEMNPSQDMNGGLLAVAAS